MRLWMRVVLVFGLALALQCCCAADIFQAAEEGDVAQVTRFLDDGVGPDAKDAEGYAPLHHAALKGHAEVARLLLSRGADVNASGPDGTTALVVAAVESQLEVAEFLLANGAALDPADPCGALLLLQSAFGEQTALVRMLLDRGVDPKSARIPEDGVTALHCACMKGNMEIAGLLLAHKADVNAKTTRGETPLQVAQARGVPELIVLLATHGAEDFDPGGPYGPAVLIASATAGRVDVARKLLDAGVDVNTRVPEVEATPLHAAASSGQEEMAALLLERGATLDAKTKGGKTPLDLAIANGHLGTTKLLVAQQPDCPGVLSSVAAEGDVEVVKALLEGGLAANAVDEYGCAPIHHAARRGHTEVVRLLLEAGVDVNAPSIAPPPRPTVGGDSRTGPQDLARYLSDLLTAYNESAGAVRQGECAGITPLHLAALGGQVETAQFLIDRGARPEDRDAKGDTWLHHAAGAGSLEVVQMALDRGADVSARDEAGRTALEWAVAHDHVAVVEFLLERQPGADPSALLLIAAMYDSGDAASYLLEHGADANHRDETGQTPLHVAARFGSLEPAKVLLDHDAPTEAKDKTGSTPLLLAAQRSAEVGKDQDSFWAEFLRSTAVEVAQALLEAGADASAKNTKGQTALKLVGGKGGDKQFADLLRKYGAGR